MIRPAALDSWPRDGTTYLLLPFHVFFTHTLTGRGREAGRRRGQPQDYALSLQPKKWACLPSPRPPSPTPPPAPPPMSGVRMVELSSLRGFPLASLARCLP